MSYKLTRRDAIAALGAVGASLAGCAAAPRSVRVDEGERDEETDGPLDAADRDRLVAAAEVLYPDAVNGIEAFVGQYADGRASDPAHAASVGDALAYLDEYCRAWFDDDFAALSPDERDEALRRMGADAADPVPDGSDVERVRYYVINDLLFALYSSPTGGELVGIENPPGHPGGLASYQRGPQS